MELWQGVAQADRYPSGQRRAEAESNGLVTALEPKFDCPAQREKIFRAFLPDVHEIGKRFIDTLQVK